MSHDQRRQYTLAGLAALTLIGLVAGFMLDDGGDGANGRRPSEAGRGSTEKGDDDDGDEPDEPTYDGWVDPASFGEPYPGAIDGLLTFRGNPTRSYYGSGPVPRRPQVRFKFPETHMCRTSTNLGETKVWCGMGWTGQPLVFDRAGRRWVVFGAYDGNVHFMDGHTGERILPDFPTDDLIKGTPTMDPDGYPLVYTGSRDNYFRVIAIDREAPTELWKLHSNDVSPVMWNDDWDASPLVLGDYVFEGGENSQFHIIKLNRAYGPDKKVTVRPELVWHTPSWDEELLRALQGAPNAQAVSVESSPTIVGNVVYFANSGGLVQGWDIGGLKDGQPPRRVFRYWTGDDTDATVVADDQGYLYVASEYERGLPRAAESGQLMKLDPRKPANPLVWKVDDTGVRPGGIWGTPAVWKDAVYAATNGGRVLGVDRTTGVIRWEKKLPGPIWGSPVVVDDVLLLGDCGGVLHAWDVKNTKVEPPRLWAMPLGGCIEATPAVWDGQIFIGSRNGYMHVLEDPAPGTTTSAG